MRRIKRIFLKTTILITLIAGIYAVLFHIKLIRRRDPGFTIDAETRINQVKSKSDSIKPGDKLIGVQTSQGRQIKIKGAFSWFRTLEKIDFGKVTLLLRDSNGQLKKVEHKIGHYPLWPKLAYSILPGLLTLFAVFYLWRKRKKNQIFPFLILTLAVTYVLILSYINLDAIAASPFFLFFFLLWNVLAPPSLLLFFLRFPRPKKLGNMPRAGLLYLPALFAFALTAYFYLDLFFSPSLSQQKTLFFVGRIIIPGTNLLYGLGTLAAIFHTLFKGKEYEKRKVILILYGFFIMLLILTSWVFLYSEKTALNQFAGGSDLLMGLYAILVITVVSSTFKQFVFKVDKLVNTSLVYGIITIGIILVYLFLSWFLGLILTTMFSLESTTITIFAAVLSTAGLFSFREMVQQYVDKMFFKTRYRYAKLLSEVGEKISSIMDIPQLFSSMFNLIGTNMQIRGASAWLSRKEKGYFRRVQYWKEGKNSKDQVKYNKIKELRRYSTNGTIVLHKDLPPETEAPKLFADLEAYCLVLLFFQHDLVGFLVFGPKENGLPYTRDDSDFLESIGKQATLAVKNSLAYTTILQLNESLTKRKEEIEKLKSRLEVENIYLKKTLANVAKFGDLVGESESIMQVKSLIQKIAKTETNVMILGESGTGKELVARSIHKLSPCKDRTLVTVNCAAIPENLLESELFGHVKGAFSGAVRRKIGQFELANNSTLFLDEIGELPLSLQPKILRAIQEGEITPLGAEKSIKVKVRLITATNRDLTEMVKAGKFREDLFYRINVLPINLPPLRDRKGDIQLLARHFLQIHSRRLGKTIEGFSRDSLRRMEVYRWPGNVRELSNVVERAVALADGKVLDREILLPQTQFSTELTDEEEVTSSKSQLEQSMPTLEKEMELPYKEAVDSFKKKYIQNILKKVDNNKSKAARIIGIRRSYLHRLIKDLGIDS
ncbi:MAG: sigma 54-interacting transcriptional regulator [Myxococcota bacterium]